MILVDTDVLIDCLRGRDPAAARVGQALRGGQVATTAVNVFELYSAATTGAAREKVEDLIGGLEVLPVDDASARRAGRVRLELEGRGAGIAMADYLVAGVALCRALPLLTRNWTDFSRVPELTLVSFEDF